MKGKFVSLHKPLMNVSVVILSIENSKILLSSLSESKIHKNENVTTIPQKGSLH